MEQWAKDWLEGQRNKGVKCLEIKQRGEKHYVYHSTTHWDREQRKAIKSSKYLGRLDYEKGLIERDKKAAQSEKAAIPEVRSVTEYGNSILLHESMKDIKPLLMEGFTIRPNVPYIKVSSDTNSSTGGTDGTSR